MNCEEALLVVDKAIFAKADRHLNDAEVTIFRGSWEGQTYDEMAEKSGYQANYLKGDAGHKFWKLLSEVLEEPVGKRNFRAAVERARSRFLLETGSDRRSQLGEVLEAKQSSSESGDAGEESQSQTLPSSRSEKPKMLWQIVLETEEISNLDALIAELEKLGEGSIMIKRIEKGSVVLIVESSPEVFERIEYLFTSGQLTEVLEIPVKDVRVQTVAVVNLRKWFDDIVDAGWQTIEELIELLKEQGYPDLVYRDHSSATNAKAGVRRCKVIDLGMQLGEIQVALVLTLMPEHDQKTNVHLRVYPIKELTLPPNLQLMVLNEEGGTLSLTESKSADNVVQLEFRGDRGDYFIVKVALGNASITEKFIL